MIYNGAYTITKWEHEVTLVMEKNQNYYAKDAIKITKVTGVIIKDTQASFTSFLNGDLDMVGLADSNYISQSEAKGFKTMSYGDGATFYLEFNLKRKELQNLKIRQAISMALNRTDFVQKIMKNNSLPALSFTSPAIRGVDPGKSFQSTIGNVLKDNNSADAKVLYAEGLKELGVTSISMGIIGDDTDRAVMFSNAIATYLKNNLGIVLKVESMPFKSRLQRMTEKNFDVVFAGWGPDYNEPMTFLDMFTTGNGNNHTSYADPAYDALVKKAQTTVDEKARFAIYTEMEKKLLADLPIAPVYFRMRDYTMKPALKGVVRSAFQDVSFIYAYVAG
jgi:oligopeptide transport system substrate-binding protein